MDGGSRKSGVRRFNSYLEFGHCNLFVICHLSVEDLALQCEVTLPEAGFNMLDAGLKYAFILYL